MHVNFSSRLPIARLAREFKRYPSALNRYVVASNMLAPHINYRSLSTHSSGSNASTPNNLELLAKDGVLRLEYDNSANNMRFHFIWLRDHCLCEKCRHPLTKQRLHDTSKISPNITPENVRINSQEQMIHILWPMENGAKHESVYPLSWLESHAYWMENKQKKCLDSLDPALDKSTRVVWEGNVFMNPDGTAKRGQFPSVSYDTYMRDEKALLKSLELLRDYGFVCIEGCPPTEKDTEDVCRRINFLRETLYGPGMWRTEIRPDPSKINDTAFTGLPLDPHTDGNYWQDTPGIQVFHCTIADAEGGGDSVLVDGYAVGERIKKEDPELFKILTTVPFPYHHTDSQDVVKAWKRVFSLDQQGDFSAFNFNNDDRDVLMPNLLQGETQIAQNLLGQSTNASLEANATSSVTSVYSSPEIVPKLYAAIRKVQSLIRDQKMQLWFALRPGTVLLFDNTRVLHGRSGFSSISERVLVGTYIGKEDWHSKLRVLHSKFASR